MSLSNDKLCEDICQSVVYSKTSHNAYKLTTILTGKKVCVKSWVNINFSYNLLQRIQVERLMVSVVGFLVMVDLIALRGKITDVARREQ